MNWKLHLRIFRWLVYTAFTWSSKVTSVFPPTHTRCRKPLLFGHPLSSHMLFADSAAPLLAHQRPAVRQFCSAFPFSSRDTNSDSGN
jgi:hypothetical protein